MSSASRIEWTQSTWNPVTGCTKISPGCKFCYAERFSRRLKAMGVDQYRGGFRLSLQMDQLEKPLHWKKPRLIFVNSMSDLFHKDVPVSYIKKVFRVMQEAHWHTFQILTKRADRLLDLAPSLEWPHNVWQGVSVESPAYLSRLDALRKVPAAVRFISFEPLLAAIDQPSLRGMDWVIVGGESGPGARAMDPEWVRGLRDEAVAAEIPFFFKQWGGVFKKKNGRLLDGRTWDEMPGRTPKRRQVG
jgi:protein gp37